MIDTTTKPLSKLKLGEAFQFYPDTALYLKVRGPGNYRHGCGGPILTVPKDTPVIPNTTYDPAGA